MTDLLQHPWIQIAAWALLHFVWQGAAIALGALLALRLARSASTRYVVGVIALALMACAPVVTVFVIADNSAFDPTGALTFVAASTSTSAVVAEGSSAAAIITDGNLQISPRLLGVIAGGWFCGLVFFAVRLAGGWVVARRIARRAVEPATEDIQRLASSLAARLGVRKAVRILQSSGVHVPMVIGWIAPTIVLPMAALSGLSGAQVEALLAHELAHIRRHDYLVNLLQSVVEVALFYHPAVWWLSRQVRADRERCCDDLAVDVCDRLVYASALGDLAALTSPRVALAATDGDLLGRVRRILSREEVVMSGRSRWSVVAVLGLATAMLVPVSMISAGPARALEATSLSQEQQVNPAQVEALKRMYEEMRARMAELEKMLAQTLGKATHDVQAHAERMERQAAEQMKHADVAKHMELMKHADNQKHAELAKHFEQMKHVEKAQRDELAKHLDLMKHEQEKTTKEAADHVKKMAAELMKHKEFTDKALRGDKEFAAAQAMFEQQMAQHAQAMQHAAQAFQQQTVADPAAARELYNLLAARQKLDEFKGWAEKDLTPIADDKATVVSGDVLRVTIGGEPDLPSMYKVTTEGTIRLPFLGAIKVVGLTSAQVREAVGKQLSDRRLGSASNVQVSLLRPRK